MKLHRSRESVVNVEPDVISTSYGYSEFVSPDGGGIIGRDFDSDGVEIVRFQLAHIEYHNTPTSVAAEVFLDPDARSLEHDRIQAGSSHCTTASVEVADVHGNNDIEHNMSTRHRLSDIGADVGMNVDEDINVAVEQEQTLSIKSSEESEPNETESLMTDRPTLDC